MLAYTWFALIGIMLAFYVVTDGFDLGIGILTLLHNDRAEHDVMIDTIGHVWDANETWLVVAAGALFGAFPLAYALLMQTLYLPVTVLIAGLIMRGAAIEFRHSVTRSMIWDRVFGAGSLVAAAAQGIILGKIITALEPGPVSALFVACSAVGVVAGYSLLGATWLVRKTEGALQQRARNIAQTCAIACVAAALVLTAATWLYSSVGHDRWSEMPVMHVLFALGALAAMAFAAIIAGLRRKDRAMPFWAAIAMFLISFLGLAISVFPDFVPGELRILDAASNSATLIFMLIGIGAVFPIMIGYNLYQYYIFRGTVVAGLKQDA
jgi:cytochrome bd ubiquinol oxidase subunit II